MAKAKKPSSGNKNAAKSSKSEASEAGKTPISGIPKSKATKTTKSVSAASATMGSTKDVAAKVEPVKTVEKKSAENTSKPTSQKASSDAVVSPKSVGQADKGPSDDDVTPKTAPIAEANTAKEIATTATPSPAQPSVTAERQSVFWPLVLGGLVAGGIGFAVAELNVLSTRGVTDEIRATLNKQQDEITALQEVEPAVPDLTEITTSIAAVSDAVGTLDARLTELENRPVVTIEGETVTPAPDYTDEMAALQSSIEAQKAEVEQQRIEIERLLENAVSVEEATASVAKEAAVRNALTEITVAISEGSGFVDALAALNDAGVEDIPAALSDFAEDGAPTLVTLQNGFPDAARDALSAARSAGVDEGTGGVSGFLRRQLGARSTAPREGSDPDAVLSRAEAAVREGQLDEAFNEIESLPPEVLAVMDGWLAQARARLGAENAVKDLSQRLTAN
ncbi:MAG: mitofilin family membrane protein [Sulfitobacter sp.]